MKKLRRERRRISLPTSFNSGCLRLQAPVSLWQRGLRNLNGSMQAQRQEKMCVRVIVMKVGDESPMIGFFLVNDGRNLRVNEVRSLYLPSIVRSSILYTF